MSTAIPRPDSYWHTEIRPTAEGRPRRGQVRDIGGRLCVLLCPHTAASGAGEWIVGYYTTDGVTYPAETRNTLSRFPVVGRVRLTPRTGVEHTAGGAS